MKFASVYKQIAAGYFIYCMLKVVTAAIFLTGLVFSMAAGIMSSVTSLKAILRGSFRIDLKTHKETVG